MRDTRAPPDVRQSNAWSAADEHTKMCASSGTAAVPLASAASRSDCLAPARQSGMPGFFPRRRALCDLTDHPGETRLSAMPVVPHYFRHDRRAEVP
jgi:hypothetical protein